MPYLGACLLCCLGGAGRGDKVAWVRWLVACQSCRLGELVPVDQSRGREVFASGDYLLSTIPNGSYPHGLAPIVINDRIGTTTALDPSCDADALGPPWVLMSCPQSSDPYGPYDVELYSLADGTHADGHAEPRDAVLLIAPLRLGGRM